MTFVRFVGTWPHSCNSSFVIFRGSRPTISPFSLYVPISIGFFALNMVASFLFRVDILIYRHHNVFCQLVFCPVKHEGVLKTVSWPGPAPRRAGPCRNRSDKGRSEPRNDRARSLRPRGDRRRVVLVDSRRPVRNAARRAAAGRRRTGDATAGESSPGGENPARTYRRSHLVLDAVAPAVTAAASPWGRGRPGPSSPACR